MNIIGSISRQFDNRPYALAKIESPHLQNPLRILFLIDTGAPRTQISSDDAYRNNLYNNKNLIQDPLEYSGIGGGKVNAYILPDYKLIFESFNKSLICPLGNLSILYPTNKQGEFSYNIKSMIGMDILRFFDILLEDNVVILRRKS